MEAARVFWIFLKLGCVAFGGPVAHLAIFRQVFVQERQWLADRDFAEIMALTQFLPGPASSQTGMAIGMRRAGYAGMFAAWLGFTLPTAALLIALGLGLTALGEDGFPLGALLGLKAAAAAIVLKAVWDMGGALCPDRTRRLMALGAAALALLLPGLGGQIAVVLAGAALGLALGMAWIGDEPAEDQPGRGRLIAIAALALFAAGLAGLPALAAATGAPLLETFSDFFRIGGLVFGGGHVVLPLMQAEAAGAAANAELFLAGYGAAQAAPGPIFGFAGFVGAAEGGLAHGLVAVLAIFAPSFLFIAAAEPLLAAIRARPRARAALAGVNAAVVGLLIAALYDPIWTATLAETKGFILFLAASAALFILKPPVWVTVLGVGALGAVVHFLA